MRHKNDKCTCTIDHWANSEIDMAMESHDMSSFLTNGAVSKQRDGRHVRVSVQDQHVQSWSHYCDLSATNTRHG